ncbi:MAG: hypothetical protein JNM43_19655 [Planctomycetaceae bacterium]|nr:hypothetical protein [Planctomycetaceae bacterium]
MTITLISTVWMFVTVTSIPPAPEWTGPLGSWVSVGYERKRLRELDNMNVFSTHEFEAEEKKLLDKESVILASFPDDVDDYLDTHKRVVEASRSRQIAALWQALAFWSISLTVTLALLILFWRHDHRIARDLKEPVSVN